MSKMRVARGSVVLNQSTNEPMSGNVIGWDEACGMLKVVWADGKETEEVESDVVLTGELYLEAAPTPTPTEDKVIKLPAYGTALVVVEQRNGDVSVDKIHSNQEITIERVARYYELKHDFDFERDNVTLVKGFDEEVYLDEWEQDVADAEAEE